MQDRGLLLVALVSGALVLVACSGEENTSNAAAGGGGDTAGPAGPGGSGGAGAAGPGGSGGGGGSAGAGTGGIIDVGPSVFAILELDHHRNRLLDTHAQRAGAADRCAQWPAMTIVERGVFLTHTDMLGHRSCMENLSVDLSDMNDSTCMPSKCNCREDRGCHCAPGSEQAVDHVFKIWAILGTEPSCCGGTDCCNGGADWHRTFFSADAKLLQYFRGFNVGLPEWDESGDFAGPHDPFTASSETAKGTPRGQTHYFANDGETTTLTRTGVEGVFNPYVIEMDNDYNILHDSNPEGTYSSQYGRARYKDNWNAPADPDKNRGDGLPTTFKGNGALSGTSEIANDEEWLPACGAAVISGVSGGADLHPASNIVISGSGFLASGNRVHVRTRTMAIALDASSPLVLSESPTAIELQLPADIGTGDGYVYVEVGGVLTNLQAVVIAR